MSISDDQSYVVGNGSGVEPRHVVTNNVNMMFESNPNNETSDDGSTSYIPPPSEWVEKYKFPLSDVTVNKRYKNSCVLTTRLKKTDQTREIIFRAEKEAVAFTSSISQQKALEEDRRRDRLLAALGGLTLPAGEKLELLVEVASAYGLPVADLTSSDPMVKVYFEDKEVHRTKHIPSTLDPVWTIKTRSLFVFTVLAEDLFVAEDGLLFVVEDFDSLGKNEVLGAVSVPPKTLYEGKGERLEYSLQPMFGSVGGGGSVAVSLSLGGGDVGVSSSRGTLVLRFRRATDYDKQFVEKLRLDEKGASTEGKMDHEKGMAKIEETKGGKGALKSITTKKEKRFVQPDGTMVTKYKVRPSSDPKRPDSTAWLTKEEIDGESRRDSFHWFDVGSGHLGRVFLEVIKCEGLPQMDTGGFAGNKTDAFVNIVYEDTIVKTDVIDDTLSPRWLPWMKRAFIFHTMHTSSQIFIGVFDYDAGIGNDHDLIGRVSVDLSNFRPETEYVLDYSLYKTAKMSKREPQGKLTIRLRIEHADERQLILSNLEPPPTIHVNVKKRKEFRCSRFTVNGQYNMDKYSVANLNSYIEELLSYLEVTLYLQDALINLFMWRGHLRETVWVPCAPRDEDEYTGRKLEGFFQRCTRPVHINIPLHSISAFLFGIYLVEHPTMIPSFSCAWVSWLLLAVMTYRLNNPSPWNKCKSFREFLEILVIGTTTVPPDDIRKYENWKKSKEWIDKWKERVETAEKEAEKARQQAIADQEEYLKEMEEIGETDVDISTQTKGAPDVMGSIDPFKAYLYPVQQYLAITCDCLRFVKYVIIWEECYFSFLICIGCLALSFLFLFVPWAFFIRWTSRLLVWGLFGPWMKLVDIYWYSKIENLTEEEREEQEKRVKRLRREQTEKAAMEARIGREDAKKLKEMKKYMFGKFITRVPVLKFDRYRDIPLPSSSAKPYNPGPQKLAELAMDEAGRNRTRVTGQHLVGDMIPTLESAKMTDAPTGQPTAHPSLLQKSTPGADIAKDSDFSAKATIGFVIAASALLTYFGVPVMFSTARWINGSVFGS